MEVLTLQTRVYYPDGSTNITNTSISLSILPTDMKIEVLTLQTRVYRLEVLTLQSRVYYPD